jgi:hypothetical protein
MIRTLTKVRLKAAIAASMFSLSFAAFSTAGDVKELGEGWRKVKGILGEDMVKDMSIEMRCGNNNNTILYTVPMSNGTTVVLSEVRNKGQEGGFEIQLPKSLNLIGYRSSVKQDKYDFWEISCNKVYYRDIDGDGVIDTMYDGRDPKNPKPCIMLEGTWTAVANYKSQFSYSVGPIDIEERSPDHSVKYVFVNGAWQLKK